MLIITGNCMVLSAQPQQITMEEAKNAAINRVANQTSFPKSTISITQVSFCENNNGNVLMYEIETDKGVTVLLSGNRKCKPILGVHGNEEGLLLNNYDSLPCGMQFLFNHYKSQINNSFQTNTTESLYIQEWQSILYDEQFPAFRTEGVQPLLSSLWTQRIPNTGAEIDAYNYLMPSGENCDHCLAGCVAVAMGQVMYYWKYPVLINSREVQIDWCNMSDRLYPDLQAYTKNRDAISYLLFECGKSVDMDYGCFGSGAETEDVRDALVDVFNYKNTADFKNRFWYSDDEWIEMLKGNLDMKMPVIYRGRTDLIGGSGHAFVCDGYNEYDEFHFNWGWYGYSGPNDYYTLNNLQPNEYLFQYHQGAIFNIKPNENQNICDIALYLDVFYGYHTSHNHPLYTATPKTMTTLISASSSSSSSYRTIPTGATAEYVAHKEVILQPGFTAEYGSDFTARIEPCAACEERLIEMDVYPSGVNYDTVTDTSVEQRVYMKGDTAVVFRTSELRMHPNPTTGELTVSTSDDIVDMGVYDLTGKRVFRWFVASKNNDSTVLDISALQSGVYILRFVTRGGKNLVGRFVKE